MTPNDIEILIHCHVSPAKHPRFDANRAVFDSLVVNGLLERLIPSDDYVTTPKGAAHVGQLCALPWPHEAWIGADGKIIKI